MLRKQLLSIIAMVMLAANVMAEDAPAEAQPKLTDEQALQQAARLMFDQVVYVATYCKSHLPYAELDYKGVIKHTRGLLGEDNIKMEIPGYFIAQNAANKTLRGGLLEPMTREGKLTEFCTTYVEGSSKLDKTTFWKTAEKAAEKYKQQRDAQPDA
ncbi:MAG: hypothetical protein R3183_01160 [Oleiphilaceae bacterium]|nr:hypothetical protein [Oleiphilaceae bacterium]